jgi:AGZA family xanthine/uracil permease-like MFS transporter
LIAYVFLVMQPAQQKAIDAGMSEIEAAHVAWRAGLAACFACGAIEFIGAFFAERIRKATPRAALLSTLAGIALGFISLGFVFRTYAHPVVGLTTLGLILLVYFGRVKFRFGLPGGLVTILVGTALAWATNTGIAPGATPPLPASLHLPIPVIGDLIAGLRADHLLAYVSVILPMGLFNVVGSLQNIESAEAAGDRYATAPSLAMNGLGSVAAACFGSCFPTTIYIGHPGWKAMGARAGYSVLNAVFATIVCLTGTLSHIAWGVPVDAGMAIVLWIGIVITAQSFQATPRAHAPAVVIGLLPGVAAWGALMAKNGLRAAGVGLPGGPPFSPALIPAFHASDTWIDGAFALEQGFIFTATILAAATVAIIEKQFRRAAVWCAAAAALSALGLMHSYRWTPGDTVVALVPAWDFALAYAAMAAWFFMAPWITVEGEGH